MGIVLNLLIDYGRIAISTTLTLMIHEYVRSLHHLICSSISFFNNLKFLSYKFITCLVGVIPG
jgi:cadmium resistance protein CadD (predicted permease)